MKLFGSKLDHIGIVEGACAMILAAIVLYALYKSAGVDLVGFTDGH